MKIKYILTRIWSFIIVIISLPLLAQAQPAANSKTDGGRAELKEAAASPDIQQELESPDGVALQLLPGGGFRIYGRGSGTYDFNEADEIRGATQDATLRAKAAITKFLKERIQTTEVMENTSIKMKKLSASSSDTSKADITKQDVQIRVEQVVSQADEVMSGLVMISSSKKPIGNGGEIQVTMGWSSKTRGTAEAIRAGKHIPGDNTSKGQEKKTSSEAKGGSNNVGTLNDKNLPATKNNQTDF